MWFCVEVWSENVSSVIENVYFPLCVRKPRFPFMRCTPIGSSVGKGAPIQGTPMCRCSYVCLVVGIRVRFPARTAGTDWSTSLGT